jgi:hypothetical protein
MRYFRRMPPLLRVVSILAVLFPLASGGLLVALLMRSLPTFPQLPVDFSRVTIIAMNLGMLGGACTFALSAYSTRLRWPDWRPFLLDSWQRQVRAIAMLAALPLVAITLALVTLVIPTTLLAAMGLIVLASAVSVLEALMLVAAQIWVLVKYAVR